MFQRTDGRTAALYGREGARWLHGVPPRWLLKHHVCFTQRNELCFRLLLPSVTHRTGSDVTHLRSQLAHLPDVIIDPFKGTFFFLKAQLSFHLQFKLFPVSIQTSVQPIFEGSSSTNKTSFFNKTKEAIHEEMKLHAQAHLQ